MNSGANNIIENNKDESYKQQKSKLKKGKKKSDYGSKYKQSSKVHSQ